MNAEKKIKKSLWIGSYQSDSSFKNMPIKNMGQASAKTSQDGLLRGLDKALGDNYVIDTIGYVPFAPYPIYPNKEVEREEWSRNGLSLDVSVRYRNTKYLNYLYRELSLKKEVKKWLRNQSTDKEIESVFVYAPSVGKVESALWLKKRTKCKVLLVIPDIPENVTVGADRVVLAAKKHFRKKLRRLMNMCDGWIFYSEYMADYYNVRQKDWVLVEGVINENDVDILDKHKKQHENNIVFLYCGSLDFCRGIKEILDAFKSIKNGDAELWFAGTGQCDELIVEEGKKDSRIKHLGFIKNREEMLALIKEADVLLHTRYTDVDSLAKYSFPSKLFEYLASGNIVISVKMKSIPSEYDKFLVYLDALSPEEIQKKMIYVMSLSKDEAKTIGSNGKNFIIRNKNSLEQAKKMVNLMKKNESIMDL